MIGRQWKFHVVREPWLLQEKLYILFEDGLNDTLSVVAPLTVTEHKRGEAILDRPTFTNTGMDNNDFRGFLQAAMDAAWKIGLKPEGYEEASSELKATKFHLEDMRELALKRGEK